MAQNEQPNFDLISTLFSNAARELAKFSNIPAVQEGNAILEALQQINRRLDRIDGRLDGIDGRLGILELRTISK